ncbi:hypothetical protein LZ30DRAFT_442897 [Colletotrichum cereale]|nr:hypothetical protein LZ30DRAFT_442897 [Colletotrichum cereale]
MFRKKRTCCSVGVLPPALAVTAQVIGPASACAVTMKNTRGRSLITRRQPDRRVSLRSECDPASRAKFLCRRFCILRAAPSLANPSVPSVLSASTSQSDIVNPFSIINLRSWASPNPSGLTGLTPITHDGFNSGLAADSAAAKGGFHRLSTRRPTIVNFCSSRIIETVPLVRHRLYDTYIRYHNTLVIPTLLEYPPI